MASLMATQVILGCHPAEEDGGPAPVGVVVPTDLGHPAELVGQWKEQKGKQTILLKEDGVCEMVNTITMGPAGASKSSDQKVSAKWGAKEAKFYFTDIGSSEPLAYDWVIKEGKLLLTNNGSKLSYSKVEEKKKP